MFRLNSRISTGIIFLAISSAPALLRLGNRGGSTAETQSPAHAPGAPAHGAASAKVRTVPDATAAIEPALIKTAGDGGAAQGQAELTTKICSFLTEYGKTQPATGNSLFCPEAADRNWRVVIAILPDPAHTHLALRFDRSIDDIQDAIQDLGWTFDHSWLPWDNKTHAESDRFQERESDVADQHGRENNPGVLLFRGGDQEKGEQEPLIILVVSDTPTRGVNPKQFHAALDTWKLLTQLPPKPQLKAASPALSILGPTFSGSVHSLRQLLSQELASQPVTSLGKPEKDACTSYVSTRVEIASGTISSRSRMEDLTVIPGLCGALLKVTPVSFAMDVDYQSDQLRWFLRSHGLGGKIMELTEAESAFGHQAEEYRLAFLQDRAALLNSICEKDDTKCDAQLIKLRSDTISDVTRVDAFLGKSRTDKGLIVAHFPREISQLRKAYEQSSIIGFGNSSSAPRSQLSFNIEEDTHDDDSVAQFSGKQETLAMETEMARIATTMNREHVSTVLLSATDVFDEVFVARYLQRQVPKVTVIIKDADQLFLRSGDDAGLDNTYVATPWPLIEENERWSALVGDSSTPHLYQSQGDEGLHNASVYLLGSGSDKMKQSDPRTGQREFGSENTKISEYRPPVGPGSRNLNSRPPLWLSVIERGNFSPVALVDVDQASDGLPKASQVNLPVLTDLGMKSAQPGVPPNGIHEPLTLSVKLVTAFIALLLFWHGAAALRSRIDRRFGWTYALADEEHRVKRLWLQAAVSFAAIPALAVLWIPHSEHLDVQPITFQFCLFALQFIAILLVMWSPYNLLHGVDGPPKNKCVAFVFKLLGILAGLCLITVLIDCFLWDFVAPSTYTPTERVFFLYRSSMLLCGSSPVLTLLLMFAAIACWLHSHFGRLAFFGHRIPMMPAGHEDIRCPSPDRLKPVTNLFSDFNRWYRWLGALVIGAVVLALIISNSPGPRSLAHGKFDWWVCLLTFCLVAMILHDLLMAVCGWRFLRQYCLLPLKQSPLRWGFNWIKGFSWRRVWTGDRGLSPEVMFDYIMRLDIANNRSNPDPSLHAAYVALRAQYYGNHQMKNEQWSIAVAKLVVQLHKALATVAANKLTRLKTLWVTDHGAITGCDPERGMFLEEPIDEHLEDEPTRTTALDRMADEEFVALLYLGYIRMVLIQIRNRIMTASAVYVLLLWSLTSYPWMNRHAILIGLSALLALISAAAIYVYAEMHRDDILSRTTETTSGKLDTEFFGKIIPTIGIPLLTLIASQFPEFSNFIFSWLEPGLRGQ